MESKIYFLVQIMSPTVPNLSKINPVCFFTAFSSEIHCNVIFPCKIFVWSLPIYLSRRENVQIGLSIVYAELTRAGSKHPARDYKRRFPRWYGCNPDGVILLRRWLAVMAHRQ